MKQQITKRAITESFRALLAVKPLDKITVRDIVAVSYTHLTLPTILRV